MQTTASSQPSRTPPGNGCMMSMVLFPASRDLAKKPAQLADKKSMTDFIGRAQEVHAGKGYDYSKAVYVNSATKLKIICPTHGEFQSIPNNHLRGAGCRLCGVDFRADNRRGGIEKFIEAANALHKNRGYTYSKAIYLNSKTKLIITCSKHGDFEQSPEFHLKSIGCQKCANISRSKNLKSNLDEFLSRARLIHKDKGYDYSKAAYTEAKEKLTITCLVHGDFEQTPHKHLFGRGCPKCAIVKNSSKQKTGIEKFLEQADLIHKDKNYNYSKSIYVDAKVKLIIVCPTHGEFKQTPDSHLNGKSGCPKCTGQISKPELLITDFINNLGQSVKTNKALSNNSLLRYDIIVESKKLVIEFNGVYWHSIANRERDYHIKKRELAESLGYEMLSIWQDDYESKKDKIEALLRRKLLGAPHRIFARKTSLLKLTPKQALAFHSEHHLQETKPATAGMHYALAYDNKIIAAASFDKTGVLHRYTIKIDTALIGGMAKLIAAYRADVGNVPITTYCDKDYFSGGLYAATGFKKVSETLQLTYLHRNRRVRRENFMKHKLPGLFGEVDMTKTEMQICLENKVYACFNSGVEKLVLPAKINGSYVR
jgi:hypothetical protein